MPILKFCLVSLTLLAAGTGLMAADQPSKDQLQLDLQDKKVKRLETSATQIGFTKTRIFYTCEDQKLIVLLSIDNTKKEFPMSGKVYLFAKDVAAADMAKWLNNQHSDGLYPDVPQPKSTVDLPAKSCQSGESKLLGQKKALDTTYNHFSLEIKLSECDVNDQFRLKEYKETVSVYALAK